MKPSKHPEMPAIPSHVSGTCCPISPVAILTFPVSGEDFLDAGLVAPFRLLPSIFSSPSTRCCSSSGRLWVAQVERHG